MNKSIRKQVTVRPEDLHNTIQWVEQLNAYANNELEPAATSEVETHIKTCSLCQAEVKAIRQLTLQLSHLPVLSVPRSFAISPQKARALNARPLYTAARVALAVAAALLIFVCTLDFSGLASQPDKNITSQANSFTPTPDITLPPIGTRPACITSNGQGNVVCNSGDSDNTVPYTASAPKVSSQTVVANANTSNGLHIAEIALVLLVLAFAAFALAVRPRAPTKIHF